MSSFSRPPLMDPREPKGLAPKIEDRGGLVLVCRNGWALRLDEGSAGPGFEVFIVRGGVLGRRRGGKEEEVGGSCATRAKSALQAR